jgi:osmotically-inducible protein OsmY
MRLSCARALALALFIATPTLVLAQDPPAQTQPDNTKVNKQDRAPGAVTADQQKMNSSDRDLTKKIRQAIVKDKSLSTYAHNIKVISQNGTVTLKGPVHTDDEKTAIEAKAAEIAGRDNVKSEITVKGEADRSQK